MAKTQTLTKASGVLTSTKDFADADIVNIGNVAYRFKTTPAAINDVLRGTSEANSLSNLAKAINGTGVGDGTDYYAGTKQVAAVVAVAGTHTVTITARLGGTHANGIELREVTDSGTGFSITRTMQGGAGSLSTHINEILTLNQPNSEIISMVLYAQNAAVGA